jgi:DNA-binding transcriptional regulator/RsmH inhibitor MraZ
MGELFIGSAICNVSSRGQLSLPESFCIAVQSRGAKEHLYLALHEEASCLIVFDRSGATERHRDLEGRAKTFDDLERHDDLLRRSFGCAATTRMDGRGRLMIAPWMKTSPGKRFQTLAVGKGDHFEVWNLNFVLEHGPDVLRMLARLHLHLQEEEDTIDEPALPLEVACRRHDRIEEPGLRLQSLPALRDRPGAVAQVY